MLLLISSQLWWIKRPTRWKAYYAKNDQLMYCIPYYVLLSFFFLVKLNS